MASKKPKVRYHLDTKGIKQLSDEDIVAILRGADDLIMQGGRALLSKILKGSRDKRVLELKLDTSPVYGVYQHVTLDQILARIDWVIRAGYLAIEYSGRLPLIVYTEQGWEIEKDTYTDELLHGFDQLLDSGADAYNMRYLKDRDRHMIFLLLEKVRASGNPKYLPLLEAWKQVDYKKVRHRIQQVIQHLQHMNGQIEH